MIDCGERGGCAAGRRRSIAKDISVLTLLPFCSCDDGSLDRCHAGTTRFMERQNQINFSVKKTWRISRIEYAPEFDLFNVLNADTVVAERSANYGTPAYGLPSRVLIGRLMRLAVRVKW